jgi:type IV pilus assembly protein PilA
MKTIQKGFTLIELMIVIAIIGILAAIAIPAYQNYTIRAQVTEGLSLAAGWKTAISEYYAQNGAFPTCSTTATAGLAGCVAVSGTTSGKYASSVVVGPKAGVITITFSAVAPFGANKKIDTLTLALSPGLDPNYDVVWQCGTLVPPAPVTVANTGATTIPAAYLPTSCHT